MERLLTPKQASELLQVALPTVYKWTHIGFMPHIKLGKCVRFKQSEIERWLKKRENKGKATYTVSS